jgi:hypothetical protein
VTVKAAYLDTLASGAHTLTIRFTSGPVSDAFTVSGASAGPGGSPTPDPSVTPSASPKPDPSVTYSTSPKPMPATGGAVGASGPLSLVFLGLGLMLMAAAGVLRRRSPAPLRRRPESER